MCGMCGVLGKSFCPQSLQSLRAAPGCKDHFTRPKDLLVSLVLRGVATSHCGALDGKPKWSCDATPRSAVLGAAE